MDNNLHVRMGLRDLTCINGKWVDYRNQISVEIHTTKTSVTT